MYRVFDLPHGYWSVITVILVAEISMGGNLNKGFQRMMGTWGGAGIGHVTALICQGNAVMIGFACCMLVFCGQYISRKPGTKNTYAYTIGVMTLAMVLLLESSKISYHIPLDRVVQISFGVLVVWAMSFLVFPFSARRSLDNRIAQLIEDCQTLFALVCADFNDSMTPKGAVSPHMDTSLRKLALLSGIGRCVGDQKKLVEDAIREPSLYNYPEATYRSIIGIVEKMHNLMQLIVESDPAQRTQTASKELVPIPPRVVGSPSMQDLLGYDRTPSERFDASTQSGLAEFCRIFAAAMSDLKDHAKKLSSALVDGSLHSSKTDWENPTPINPLSLGLSIVLSRFDTSINMFFATHLFRTTPLEEQLLLSVFAHAVRQYLAKLPVLAVSLEEARTSRTKLRFGLGRLLTMRRHAEHDFARLLDTDVVSEIRSAAWALPSAIMDTVARLQTLAAHPPPQPSVEIGSLASSKRFKSAPDGLSRLAAKKTSLRDFLSDPLSSASTLTAESSTPRLPSRPHDDLEVGTRPHPLLPSSLPPLEPLSRTSVLQKAVALSRVQSAQRTDPQPLSRPLALVSTEQNKARAAGLAVTVDLPQTTPAVSPVVVDDPRDLTTKVKLKWLRVVSNARYMRNNEVYE